MIHPNDVAVAVQAIHKDLEEFIAIIQANSTSEGEKPSPWHISIKLEMFDGQWMGHFFPSALAFPFGITYMQRGVHGKSLADVLRAMKDATERQLELAQKQMVDALPGCGNE